MNERKLQRYIYETFNFDVKKEKLIYLYLCKEKLRIKEERRLNDEEKFISYVSWKKYICDKYIIYDSRSLGEFERMLNMLMRNSKGFDVFNKCIWGAYISVLFSIIMDKFIDYQNLISTILILFLLVVLLLNISRSFETERKYLHFLQDVHEIIKELIECKNQK